MKRKTLNIARTQEITSNPSIRQDVISKLSGLLQSVKDGKYGDFEVEAFQEDLEEELQDYL